MKKEESVSKVNDGIIESYKFKGLGSVSGVGCQFVLALTNRCMSDKLSKDYIIDI